MEEYNLGMKIRSLRTKKNMTQERMAEYMNVSRQTITKWEANQSKPSTNNLILLAKFFDVSINELTKTTKKEKAFCRVQQFRFKLFTSLIIYTGACVLYLFGQGDALLQTICLFVILLMAILMSAGIWKLQPSIRLKYAINQLFFCILNWISIVLISNYIGNILAAIFVIMIAGIWVKQLGHAIENEAVLFDGKLLD